MTATSGGTPNNNKAVIAGALLVLVAGGAVILAYKGYFRGAPADNRQDATRFTNFAKQAEAEGWNSEAPTALAEQVKDRIDRDTTQYSDKRFAALKTQFQTLEQSHKQGKQTNTEYQAALIRLDGAVEALEDELDPEASGVGVGKGNGVNGKPGPGAKNPGNPNGGVNNGINNGGGGQNPPRDRPRMKGRPRPNPNP